MTRGSAAAEPPTETSATTTTIRVIQRPCRICLAPLLAARRETNWGEGGRQGGQLAHGEEDGGRHLPDRPERQRRNVSDLDVGHGIAPDPDQTDPQRAAVKVDVDVFGALVLRSRRRSLGDLGHGVGESAGVIYQDLLQLLPGICV